METRARKRLQPGDAIIIAKALDTTPGYVSQVLNGDRNNNSIKKAHQKLRKLKTAYRKQLVQDLKIAVNQ